MYAKYVLRLLNALPGTSVDTEHTQTTHNLWETITHVGCWLWCSSQHNTKLRTKLKLAGRGGRFWHIQSWPTAELSRHFMVCWIHIIMVETSYWWENRSNFSHRFWQKVSKFSDLKRVMGQLHTVFMYKNRTMVRFHTFQQQYVLLKTSFWHLSSHFPLIHNGITWAACFKH